MGIFDSFNRSGGATNALGVSLNADRYAQDTQAALTRDQWNTYLSMFMPVENELISYSMDVQKPAQAADRALGMVDQAFDANAGVADRRRRAYGITLNADEQAAVDRSNNLNESLAKVQAANAARTTTIANQRQVMGGGSAMGVMA